MVTVVEYDSSLFRMTSHGVRQHATKDKGVIEVQSGQTVVDIAGCMDGRVCRYLYVVARKLSVCMDVYVHSVTQMIMCTCVSFYK